MTAPEDLGGQQDNRVLNYIKRRDCCVLVTFIVYFFGPLFYDKIESLNDVDYNVKRVDFGRMFSGTEGMIYDLKKEIYEVQDSIGELKRRDFGWRDVWDDMTR